MTTPRGVRLHADLEDPVTNMTDNTQITGRTKLMAPAYRALHLPTRRVFTLASLAFLSGLGTTTALVMLIQVALRVADGDSGGSIAIVGFDLSSLSVGIMFAAALISAALVLMVDLLAATQTAHIVASVQTRLRRDLFDAYSESDWVTRSGDRAGHLQDIVATNVTRALNLTAFVVTGIVALLSLVTMVTSAVLISPVATAAMMVSLASMIAVLTPLARRIRAAAEATRQANHDYAVELAEFTSVPTEITTFGVSDQVREAHEEASVGLADRHSRLVRLEKAVPALQRNLALLAVLATLAVVHRSGLAGIGELGAVVVLLGRSLSYAHGVQQTVNKFAAAGPFVLALEDETNRYRSAAAGRIRPDSHEPNAVDPAPVDGSITVDGVSYIHPGSLAPTLLDVSVNIASGEFVAIVGPSGSGKTTLAEVLLRLRRPTSGRLLVGSARADSIRPGEWSAAVAYVPQKPSLMTGSVADNVRFRRPGIDDDAVDRALAAAGLLDDTDLLPNGRDTLLGPAQRRLSGGQLQRLAMARAVAGSPRIIVLDEPTSALDPLTEQAIHHTLMALAGTITIVVIAHRATIVNGCDHLIAMADGRVIADGSPRELALSGPGTTSEFALEVMAPT